MYNCTRRNGLLIAWWSIVGLAASAGTAAAQQLSLQNARLQYPTPATPYYHFYAELNLPTASMVEVEASINGEKLRLIGLKERGKPVDPNRPIIHYRPAFADTYAVNTIVYREPCIIGWLPWQPGKEYKLQVKVRMKKDIQPADADIRLTGSTTLIGPQDANVFDPAWKDYKAVVLSETAGLGRTGEPIDIVLAFYADQALNLANAIRVVGVDPTTHAITEVPSQAYDIKTDVATADPNEPNEQGQRRGALTWLPTVTARVAFLADVGARSSKVYLVYHNNPDATPKQYDTSLKAAGAAPGVFWDKDDKLSARPNFTLENDKIKVVLHRHSGVIDELTLKSRPEQKLFHKMETNGAIHWAPEAYSPPRPWTHTSDWKEPKFDVWRGPVVITTLTRAGMPYIPEADAAVSYKIYAGQPYIVSTTSLRINEALRTMAMRNGEVVFKRGLLTHLAWHDVISDRIETVDLEKVADLDEHLMEADVPWLSFFNPETGIAFGGVQLEHAAAGLEHLPRVLNPYFYAIVGPIVYWSRAMNFTFASSASQLMVEVPKGSLFWEKWAYVLYEPAKDENPHAPLITWQKKLSHPLRVRLVEETESRVPTIGTEIYIDPAKTGWENRETVKKHEPAK